MTFDYRRYLPPEVRKCLGKRRRIDLRQAAPPMLPDVDRYDSRGLQQN